MKPKNLYITTNGPQTLHQNTMILHKRNKMQINIHNNFRESKSLLKLKKSKNSVTF